MRTSSVFSVGFAEGVGEGEKGIEKGWEEGGRGMREGRGMDAFLPLCKIVASAAAKRRKRRGMGTHAVHICLRFIGPQSSSG